MKYDITRTNLVNQADWVYAIDPFTKEEIGKACKEFANLQPDMKEAWTWLNFVFQNFELGDKKQRLPLAVHMELLGQQKCIDKLQGFWEWTAKEDGIPYTETQIHLWTGLGTVTNE